MATVLSAGAGDRLPPGLRFDWQAFLLLSEGVSQVAAARRLKVDRRRVNRATVRLLRRGYLREQVPGARPPIYSPGPHAGRLRAVASSPLEDRGGRSGPTVARVHKRDFRWRTDGAPGKDPPWRKTPKEISGVFTASFERVFQGRTYTLVDRRGKKLTSLTVHAGEEFTLDPAAAGVQGRLQGREVAQMVREVAAEFHYRLVGELEEVQSAEVGFRADGLPTFGRSGVDPVWVDRSKGYPELETNVGPAAQAFLGLPDFMDETKRQLAGLMALLRRLAEEGRDLVGAVEKVATIQAGQERVSVALLSHQLGAAAAQASPSPPSPPPPVDDRNGYA